MKMLSKKMKSFDQLVHQAKKHISEIDFHKSQVAALALKVCEIKTGRPAGGTYTVKEFADSIGIKYERLMNWVRIYRDVCIPAGKTSPTPGEWSKASSAHKKVTDKAAAENKFIGMDSGKKPKTPTKDEFKDEFFKVMNGESSDIMGEIYKEIRRIYHRVEKLDLNTQDTATLNNTMILIDRMSDKINDHLTSKKKRAC